METSNIINLVMAIFTALGVIVAIAVPIYQNWLTKQIAKAEKLELLLSYFERQAFKASERNEDPVEMYLAIRETRISIQKDNAQISDDLSTKALERIVNILLKTESRVQKKFPIVVELSKKLTIPVDTEFVKKKVGKDYTAAVKLMISIRENVWKSVGKIEERKELFRH